MPRLFCFMMMDFLNELQNFIEEKRLFSKEEQAMVACSGGVDSMVLLEALKTLGYAVSACHVHHGLRETAQRDADFVREYCRENDIPFVCKYVNVSERVEAMHESVEEAARNLRYAALMEAKEELGAVKIALAHHKNDQAETVLFHLVRGSGLRGLSGMEASDPRGLVRPLLFATRAEILDYAKARGLNWCEDETNDSDEASRNRIRHTVIPGLETVREDAVEKIAETAGFLGEADAYFRKKAEDFLANHAERENGCVRIVVTAFQAEDPLIQNYAIMGVLRQLSVPMKDKGRTCFEALKSLFFGAEGAETELPGGGFGVKTYDTVTVSRSKSDYEADIAKRFANTGMKTRTFSYEKGMKIPDSLYTKWFDYGKIKGQPILRKKETGDLISTAAGTHKKLKEFFIDEKIPKAERLCWPIVADEEKVLWVVGKRMSEDCKVTESTATILEITITGRDEHER